MSNDGAAEPAAMICRLNESFCPIDFHFPCELLTGYARMDACEQAVSMKNSGLMH